MKNLNPEFIIVITVIIFAYIGLGFIVHQGQELKHQEIIAAIKRCAE